jgi:integrase
MVLTDIAVKNAKPGPKLIRLKDERGLYLEISPQGGKWWRLRYWIDSKENRLSLGVYPEVSLKDARERRDEARKMIASGIDPSEARKEQKAGVVQDSLTFEAVAREWHGKTNVNYSDGHKSRVIRDLERDAFPFLGDKPIAGITSQEILATVKRIAERGAPETGRRVLQNIGAVFRYAVVNLICTYDPAAVLRGVIPPPKKRHYATLTDPREVAGLLRAIEEYKGSYLTKAALQLLAYTFVRPGEIRHAEWAEIDAEAREWRIPAAKTKMNAVHIVPLAKQAVAILEAIRPLTGRGKYLFPSERSQDRAMSSNTLNAALRRLGYTKEEICSHGFRGLASTRLNELGFNKDWIERQLAHGERDKIRASYNHAEYLAERRKMMDFWATHLDGLKTGAKVTPFRRAATADE